MTLKELICTNVNYCLLKLLTIVHENGEIEIAEVQELMRSDMASSVVRFFDVDKVWIRD